MMDKVRLTLVGIVALIASWAMLATQTWTEPIIELGPMSLTTPYILFIFSIVFLVWLWTPILESMVKMFMSGTFAKILFFIVLIFGIVATIDILLAWLFGINIGFIEMLKNAFS